VLPLPQAILQRRERAVEWGVRLGEGDEVVYDRRHGISIVRKSKWLDGVEMKEKGQHILFLHDTMHDHQK